jgi:hydrogenase-4 component B
VTAVFAVAMGGLAVGAFTALWLPRAAAAILTAACGALAVVGIAVALGDGPLVLELGSWLGFGHSALRGDGLAGLFFALTAVTGAAVSLGYVELPAGRLITTLHGALLLFVAVAVGSDNAFLFFLAWEAVGVCIYLLASADRARPEALVAGYFTGVLTKVGGAALLAAFALLYARTQSFSLVDWQRAAPTLPSGTRDVLFVLFVAAFATKVGIVPLQGALPAGYGAAPRAGAASLSVALAAGFYGLWRFVFETIGPARTWWGDALLIAGGLTAVAGVLYALTQDDMRRFLGFSTVEHTGVTLVGFGVALLGQAAGNKTLAAAGLLAATLHVVAHGLGKTLALLAVDRVQQATGRRTMDPLGGLGPRMPPTSVAIALASLTLAAIPPLGGFVSEWFTFEALLQGFRLPTLLARLLCALAAAALALTAGLGLLAFAKLLGFTVLGPARGVLGRVHEPARRAVSVIVLSAVVLFLGTAAPWEVHLLGSGLQPVLGFDAAAATISHPLVLGPVFADFSVLAPTWLTIVLPLYAAIAVMVVRARMRPAVRRAPVWVCGTAADLTAVQYRPSSYSNPIRVVLRGPLGYRSALRRATDEDGPGPPLVLETRVVLAVDRFLYQPLARAALAVSARTRRLQSGRLSDYLLYMLATLIVVLALIPILR